MVIEEKLAMEYIDLQVLYLCKDMMTKELAYDMFHWSLSSSSKLEQLAVLLAQMASAIVDWCSVKEQVDEGASSNCSVKA